MTDLNVETLKDGISQFVELGNEDLLLDVLSASSVDDLVQHLEHVSIFLTRDDILEQSVHALAEFITDNAEL